MLETPCFASLNIGEGEGEGEGGKGKFRLLGADTCPMGRFLISFSAILSVTQSIESST